MNFDFAPILTRLHDMWQASIRIIPNLVIALLVFGLSLLVARLASRMVGTLVKRAGQPQSIVLLFTRIASWLVRGLGALIAMTIVVPTLTAASLFGALGVTGIAIGFAFKDIFQNLLAGMLILITRPFRIGDQIVSGSHEGTVEDIQVRATLLRTYDNRCVVIPNGELYTSRVVVNTAYETIRIGVAVGIGYGDDIEQAKQVALTTLEGLKGILRDPPPKVAEVEHDPRAKATPRPQKVAQRRTATQPAGHRSPCALQIAFRLFAPSHGPMPPRSNDSEIISGVLTSGIRSLPYIRALPSRAFVDPYAPGRHARLARC